MAEHLRAAAEPHPFVAALVRRRPAAALATADTRLYSDGTTVSHEQEAQASHRAWNFGLRATKSVSEFTSTSPEACGLVATPTSPSAATRVA